MKFAFTQAAPAGEVFAPDAFADQTGKEIPVKLPQGAVTGWLVRAVVAPDGRSAEFEVDADLPTPVYRPGAFGVR
jgi:hypothetical protein